MDDFVTGIIALMGLGVMIIVSLIGFILAIIDIVALGIYLKRAGENPLWAICPIGNMWKVAGVLYGQEYSWVGLIPLASAIPVIGGIVALIVNVKYSLDITASLGKSLGYGIINIFFGAITFPLAVLTSSDVPRRCELLNLGKVA